jgi:dTDP-4-dehydrorhamnose reductase
VYHLAGRGYASRFEMAQKILELLPQDYSLQTRRVLPALTSDFNDAARRPVFSALDCGKFIRTFGVEPPAWEVSLREAFAEHFQPTPTPS